MNVNGAFLLVISWMILLSSCYNQVALSGGPRDEVPPQIDTSKSTKNFQTNFVKQPIILEFDEYVDLRDASTQIVISPPLDELPKIANRLKKVQFEFNEEEVLKEDVTYVINFGKSIRDFTEGNELLNYTFVFSTGDYIDSLSLKGVVLDAKSREPKEDALVLLYINHQDSIVFKERPFYFARTDKEGTFQINNLRADTFKVVTLIDQNLNYLYDPSNEEIGFLDSLIILTDTLTPELELTIFKESTQPRYRSFEILAQGRIRIDFEGQTSADAITVLDSLAHYVEYKEDEQYLTLWYRPRNLRSLRYGVMRGGAFDTIQARINLRSVDTLDNRIVISGNNVVDPQIGLHPKQSLQFVFDRPVSTVNMDFIQVVDTLSKDTLAFHRDSLINEFPAMSFSIGYPWTPEQILKVTFYPGSVIDFFNRTIDTTELFVRIAQEIDFGEIVLKPVDFDTGNYVFQLMSNKKVVSSANFDPGQTTEISFKRLIPGSYEVQIIDDKVPNGKWDPGNYLERRQAETIYRLPLSELRPNWLLEEEIRYSELQLRLQPKTSPDENR